VDAVVAGVPHPIAVGVRLVGIGEAETIVDVVACAVMIGVVRRIVGAAVAGIAASVAVRVLLPRVGQAGAVVGCTGVGRKERVPEPIPVHVGAGIVRIRNAVAVGVGIRPLVPENS